MTYSIILVDNCTGVHESIQMSSLVDRAADSW